MPADDLAAADAVGIVQDDVKGLDLGVRGEEGFGLGGVEPEGLVMVMVSQAWKRSVRMASKLAISRSTWSSSWPG
jgi:hypothetical protein